MNVRKAWRWLKQRAKSKTHWLALGTLALGGLQTAQANIHGLGIPADKVGWVLIGIGIASHILREVTTKPVADK